jgi:hypothetical protein
MMFYRERATYTTRAATVIDGALSVVRPGRVRKIYAISVSNATGETLQGSYGILDGTDFFYLSPLQNVVNNYGNGLVAPFFVFEGQTVDFRCHGTSDSGPFTIAANGIEFDELDTRTLVAEILSGGGDPSAAGAG